MSGAGAPSWDDCVLGAASALDAARASGVTLGCAESCTGGLVAGALTAVAGSSDVMRGGVVSYAIPVKHEVLGVSSEVLDEPGVGAVSGECAEQMAEGARRVLGCGDVPTVNIRSFASARLWDGKPHYVSWYA